METPTVQSVQEPVKIISKNKIWPYVAVAFAVVILGVGSAWLISSKIINRNGGAGQGVKVTSTEAGALDPKTKYDNATGNLKDGGIGGQGTQHLEREGGASHYVYLTSSVIDLSGFVGKKVQVWGQTLASKQAPWLMDVAKIQVVQ